MRIFLNERIVEFTETMPEKHRGSEMIACLLSPGQLRDTWAEFEHKEQYHKLVLTTGPDYRSSVDAGPGLDLFSGYPPVFIEFTRLFKYIPAAGGLVRNQSGEYLFIYRFGYWDLPKGKIDRKDAAGLRLGIHDPVAARKAAVREVCEETGLKDIMITGVLPSTWHIYKNKEKNILKQTFWFSMIAAGRQSLKPAADEGIERVEWIPVMSVNDVLPQTYASLRALLDGIIS